MENLNELALFAGAGGGILGGHLLGWKTVCAVEWEPYPASVLCARQNDKIFPPFPVWDDVQTFDGRPWAGIVDVVSGGFPCQDISAAGKGAGIEGNKSSMWKHMARIIGEVRPQYVFVENSPMLTTRGLGVVLADLSSLGFDAKWGVVSAADVGANHQRERIWIRAEQRNFLSHAEYNGIGRRQQQSESTQETDASADTRRKCKRANERLQLKSEISIGQDIAEFCKEMANTNGERGCLRKTNGENAKDAWQPSGCATRPEWWDFEPNVGRVSHGVAARVHRLKAIGNGQVPLCAATAWELLK